MNKQTRYVTLVLFFCLIGFSSIIRAQNNKDSLADNLLNLGEVISIGERNLTLKDAFKINPTPTLFDTVLQVSPPGIEVNPIQANTAFEIQPLKAARLKIVDPLSKYYRAYILGGIGLYISPKVKFNFNSLRSRKWNYGVDLDYFSGKGGIKNVPSSNWGNTVANGWVKHYLKKSAVSLNLGYSNNIVHYYGGLQDISVPLTAEQIRQGVNRFNAEIGIKGFQKDTTKLNYSLYLNYKTLGDQFQTSENQFGLIGNVNLFYYQNIRFSIDYYLHYNSTFSVPTQFRSGDLPPFVVDSLSLKQNNTLWGVNPWVEYYVNKFIVSGGINLTLDGSFFHLYPKIDIRYRAIPGLFSVYAGIDGNVEKNTFSSNFDNNPYILTNINLKNTNQKFVFYAGIDGSFLSRFNYKLSYTYKNYEDMGLYFNDTTYSYQNRFNIVYDDVKVNDIYAAINYNLLKKLTVGLDAHFFNYTAKRQLFTWEKPSSKISLLIDYNLSNKFLVNLAFYYIGYRYAASLIPVEGIEINQGIYAVKLDSYVDANLRFEYRYTKRISVFVSFNNLFSVKYQTFYKYQVQPFFGLIGASFSF